jgi:citrate lyase subunit beta / citryl-CoA lyase
MSASASLKARPRRSVLYMPGANTRALEKARGLPADGLIFDLEDATAPDAKVSARENVIKAVAEGGYGKREIFIRMNSLDSPWGQADAVAIAKSKADAILIPKVESASHVQQVEAILDSQGAPESLRIWCMMETPRGILRAEEIAGASRRLAGFVLGTSDLAKDLRAAHTPLRLPMITSLGITLLAARAYGLSILDGVYLNLEDDAGFAESCLQGQELGFDGKTLIHPKQVQKTNEVFAPSEADVAWARKIIAAHAEAEAQGKGVVLVDGKLIENLHVVGARQKVELAEAIAELGTAP